MRLVLIFGTGHYSWYNDELFARLYSYGIRDSVLLWLKNFLTGHTNQTKISFSFSDICNLISGIVQGSYKIR